MRCVSFRGSDWLSVQFRRCFFWLQQQIGAGSMLRAAVLTAVPVLVTGGIHLDGYLDTMDALSSWREKNSADWKS